LLSSNISSRCPHNMVNFGLLAAEIDPVVWGKKGKGKGFPYSIPSVGPGADPGVQVVSLQVTVSHPPGGRLPLLSAKPAITSPCPRTSSLGHLSYCNFNGFRVLAVK